MYCSKYFKVLLASITFKPKVMCIERKLKKKVKKHYILANVYRRRYKAANLKKYEEISLLTKKNGML